MTGRPMRVLLADRPGVGRRALAALLGVLPGLELVGEAEDQAGLAQGMRRLRPDLVLIDDRVLRTSGIPVHDSHVRVVVMGVDDAVGFAARALRHGAVAWLPKERVHELLPPLVAEW